MGDRARMGNRNRWTAVVGLLGVVLVPQVGLGDDFVIPDPTEAAYYNWAAVAPEILLSPGATIEGSVYANDRLHLGSGAVVTEDASVVNQLTGTGTVQGDTFLGVSPIEMPTSIESKVKGAPLL